ncbi:MAG TPA: nuclear transport factor 2 family protein [Terriglobales bacterium]|nr:nuclear transport factor 2 family protein [Terriglobales bacterium]
MRKRWAVLFLLLGSIALASSSDKGAIRKTLNDQVRAWNAHDLRGYMQGYWNSPELTFYSGGTVTRGWQATLERYQKRYQGEGREMGALDFEILEVQLFSKDAAVVYGKWHLKMADGKEPRGLFTVVVRKFGEGWRIVHDHTSAE